jgi:hypothetical protein
MRVSTGIVGLLLAAAPLIAQQPAPPAPEAPSTAVLRPASLGMVVAPSLAIELTDIEVGGHVIPLATEPQKFSGEAKKPGKKIIGGAALGAGIGAMVDGGEGAAWGAGIGAVAGVAKAANSPGNQVAVAPGTAIEFRLTRPLSMDVVA